MVLVCDIPEDGHKKHVSLSIYHMTVAFRVLNYEGNKTSNKQQRKLLSAINEDKIYKLNF